MEQIQPITKEQAIARITAMMHRAFVGGNVDREKELFEEILRKVRENEITPEEGIGQAEAIENSRNER